MKVLWQTIKSSEDWKTLAYNWCYLVSKLNASSLLFWDEVSDNEYKWFLAYMTSLWHNPLYGKVHTANIEEVNKWRKDIKWEKIQTSEIKLFSSEFRVNVFRKVPMVVSINVWDQFRVDREDGRLDDTIFNDTKKTWHAVVIYGWNIVDSRRDQKRYSFTRKYLETVWWLFGSTKVLVFKKG